jgi:hypothetical protein
VAGVIDARGGLRQPVALFTSARTAQVRQDALEAGALEAVCGWRFHPATAAGQPVAMVQTVVFRSSRRLVSPFFSVGSPGGGPREPAWSPPSGHTPLAHGWEQH